MAGLFSAGCGFSGMFVQGDCLLMERGLRSSGGRSRRGIDSFISGHSLRVGSAVSLAQAGAGIPDMQAVGRWKDSNMPARYASAQLAERSAIARLKYGRGGVKQAR